MVQNLGRYFASLEAPEDMRKTLLIATALLVLVAGTVRFRFPIAAYLVSLEGRPPLGPQGELAANERWFDDYYTVAEIDPDTFAPRSDYSLVDPFAR